MRVPQIYTSKIKLERLLAMAREKKFDPQETIKVGMQDFVFASEITGTFYPDVRLFGVKLDVIS